MRDKKYICRTCGREFVLQVYDEGEAEEKGVRGYSRGCRPFCKSSEIEPN